MSDPNAAPQRGLAGRSAAARSVTVFGLYLVVLGAGLALAPNPMLAIFRQPPTSEPWLRVLGIVAGVLGGYYLAAARGEAVVFFRASVWGRVVGAAAFALLVVCGIAPKFVLLMAALDAAGAAWTRGALGKSSATR
ncbi:MAG TPA: hypothetical protein VMQ62_03320 [Dongiaceae bacterium]|nr:hypothetical protein [Dongiaceae bacterium]